MPQSPHIRYLLVEDSLDHATLITEALQEANPANKVTHLRDGEQLLAELRRGREGGAAAIDLYDLVLLDLKMPRLNGVDTLSILKADPGFEHVPVVVISTSRAEREVKNCYRLGAAGYITKPVQLDGLKTKLFALHQFWSVAAELPVQEQSL